MQCYDRAKANPHQVRPAVYVLCHLDRDIWAVQLSDYADWIACVLTLSAASELDQ
jgi:hypothetical protein